MSKSRMNKIRKINRMQKIKRMKINVIYIYNSNLI
jgi:hypothetical protein